MSIICLGCDQCTLERVDDSVESFALACSNLGALQPHQPSESEPMYVARSPRRDVRWKKEFSGSNKCFDARKKDRAEQSPIARCTIFFTLRQYDACFHTVPYLLLATEWSTNSFSTLPVCSMSAHIVATLARHRQMIYYHIYYSLISKL
jgi:hypothetical protein